MFFPESQVRIWLYNRPADMRKSYDGLSALVNRQLEEDPLSGHLFVFINRRKTQCKLLYFDRSGYCIWSKRLEQGQFHAPYSSVKQSLSWTELKMMIEGIDVRSSRQYKRYQSPTDRNTQATGGSYSQQS